MAFTKYILSLIHSKTHKHDYTGTETLLQNNNMLYNSLPIQFYNNVYIHIKILYD